MATMREIRTRIRTVKNIEKITRAMKLVAAARLRRAQERVGAARPYAEKMEQMMRRLSAAGADIQHPLLEVREERNVAVLVITPTAVWPAVTTPTCCGPRWASCGSASPRPSA